MKSETLLKCHDKMANNAKHPAAKTLYPSRSTKNALIWVLYGVRELKKKIEEGINAACRKLSVHASVLRKIQRPTVTM